MIKKQAAFTLVEVLVTMVVTGIIFSSVMVSYMSFNTMNRKINHWRQLQKETNFAMIRLTDKVREFSINYNGYNESCSGDLIGEEYKCKCKDQSVASNLKLCVGNAPYNYNFFEKKSKLGFSTDNLFMNDQPLFSDLFKVDQILFFNVTPICDPSLPASKIGAVIDSECPELTDTNELSSQPKVTILLKVSSRQDPDITMTLQTTVSARVYNF